MLRILALLLAALPVVGAAAQGQATPDWLVYLARDHAVGLTGKQTERDVVHVRTLLDAALRLDDKQELAHRWLYELNVLEGDRTEAALHLQQLVAIDPGNESAWFTWLQTGPKTTKLDARRTWLQQQLAAATNNTQRAMVHLELGEVAFQRLDLTEAGKQLATARGLDPTVPGVATLGVRMLDENAPREIQLQVLLAALEANPVQIEVPWRIAVLLDDAGRADLAAPFYEHALSVHDTTAPDQPIPAAYLRQMSRNALARDERAAAIAFAQKAAAADRTSYTSSFYLLWLFRATEQLGQARVLQETLDERFAPVKEPAEWPVEVVAAVAWYHCTFDPQPERALLLAQAAHEKAPSDPFARRVLGWAQALNDDAETAIETLRPLPKVDPQAAVKLADLLLRAGRGDEARRVIEQTKLPVAGYVREEVDRLGLAAAASQPSDKLAALIEEVDPQVMLFHRAPWRFLQAEIIPVDLSPGAAEPWFVDLKLTNQGALPISLGPSEMVNPVFLLSFEMQGDKDRAYPSLLTISLDGQRVLAPGESMTARRRIDLGPLRSIAARTPQQLQRVSIEGWLDPQQQGGTWRASATGQELKRVSLNRRPIQTTRETWNAIFTGMESTNATAVYRSVEALAGLLAEAQYARIGRLQYEPAPVPQAKIRDTLVTALNSPIWQVRVRALGALRWTGLDEQLNAAVESALQHEHWLVRMMAVRLLGQRLGDDFVDRARQLQNNDPDDLVRRMAGCFVPAAE